MSLTIGRVGIDVPLDDPEEYRVDGDQLRISGQMNATSLTDLQAIRAQLLGYVGSQDEPVVPFRWDQDTTQSGFVAVTGVQIDTYPMSLTTGFAPFQIDMQRIRGFQSPIVETTHIGAVRTNGLSVTAADPRFAFPYDGDEFFTDAPNITGTLGNSATGNLFVGTPSSSYTTATTFRARCSMSSAPATFYAGACTVSDGTTKRLVVGRQVGLSLSNWQLDNGLVKITSSNLPAPWINVAHWDGAQYDTALLWKFLSSVGTYGGETAVTVLRNSPECATIRLSYGFAHGNHFAGRAYTDLTITRGDKLVRGVVTADATGTWSLKRGTNEAGTAITGGVRATSNDASGNRYVVLSSLAKTNDLTVGGFTTTGSVTTFDFAIGSEVGGTGATAPDTATTLSRQYFWAGNVAQRVVSR